MNNPFQEQLLKAGVVSKQQVQKAQQEKNRRKKQQRSSNKPVVNEAKLKAQQAAAEKARHDRELNRQKEDQARGRAISAEINQLILENRLDRSEKCDIAYNFEHQKKVKQIYINEEMKAQIVKGKLGIARINGRYELVPLSVAEKIQQRNEKRIVIFADDKPEADKNDPYAGYDVPDDLIW
ncbi:hypothetical protein MNBD_GAMMA11-1730 [hydrothermal vent metagenome]|uniref:Nucleoprotein/polynucleotide-associated enzyme n=1 Tax=hydrothermal vent metagenome TaxID=652676 RepID=A0A3B0X3K0_9ZZZZ